MSSHSSYARNTSHPRSGWRNSQLLLANKERRSDLTAPQLYSPQPSMHSSDSGHNIASSREMGPPPPFHSDFTTPPRPIEIEVHSSRTLPSPSVPSSTTWDNFSTPGFGGFSEYGSGRPLPLDTHIRTNAPDPLQQWYTGNDGPWIPKGISTVPEERLLVRTKAGTRIPLHHGNNYRQPNPSDAGTLHYGVAPSDSGYGTRHSDGNASVFSADVNDREQDCQNLGHVTDFQPFQSLNEVMQQRDTRSNEHWLPIAGSSPSRTPSLLCPTCQKPVKTPSELK